MPSAGERETDRIVQNATRQAHELIRLLSGKQDVDEKDREKLARAHELLAYALDHLRMAIFNNYQKVEMAEKHNEKLTATLQEAKAQIEALQAEAEKFIAPPSSYGIFYQLEKDGRATISLQGRKMLVCISQNVDRQKLVSGKEVALNGAFNIIEVHDVTVQGEVVRLKDLLEGNRVLITLHFDEERVAELGEPLTQERLSVGDHLLYDPRSGYVVEKLQKSELEDLVLEEVPNVTYEDIGGLEHEIERVRDAVELPFLHPELFAAYKLAPPKGVLLYGPPGCGKTMIAKAVANSIAKKLGAATGKEMKSYFLHVKGPELLNKYVGESERQVREVFKKAKERASGGHPVIVFFDEMDALFRTRGTGISSDTEATIVPQFLAEIDGVERLKNVIVIGASNRQDLIDPAVLRSGRLDVKVKIGRPGQVQAVQIFEKYLTPDLPFSQDLLGRTIYRQRNRPRTASPTAWDELQKEFLAMRQELIVKEEQENGAYWETWDIRTPERLNRYIILKLVAVLCLKNTEEKEISWISASGNKIYFDNRFVELTYADGTKETLYFGDFLSGAVIEGIVSNMKKYSIKRVVEKKQALMRRGMESSEAEKIANELKGMTIEDGYRAIREYFSSETINSVNVNEWGAIEGKKGKKIVHVSMIANNALTFMVGNTLPTTPKITVPSAGHYL